MRYPLARLPCAFLLILLLGPHALADEADELLARGRNHEFTSGDHEQALQAYTTLLARKDVADAIRLEAMMGAARCHLAAGTPRRAKQAAELWRAVIAAPGWSDAEKQPAQRRLDAYDAVRSAKSQDLATERELRVAEAEAQRRTQAKAEAKRRMDLAEAAFEEGDITQARMHLDESMKLGGYTPRVQNLLNRIVDRHPDTGQLIRDLTQFIESKDLGDLHELLRQTGQLYEVGKSEYGHRDYKQADQALLTGIDLIDESGFLVSADVMRVDELADMRSKLVWFAVFNRNAAQKNGLAFDRPIPDAPESSEGHTLMNRLRFLLADVFGGREDSAQPLRFYVFLPPGSATEASRSLTTSELQGLSAARTPGALGRVRWAERYIRANVAASWKRGRILQRFGHVLCVKHQPSVHRRLSAIRDAFGPEAVPTHLDVHVFTTNVPGIAKACEALGARAPRNGAGHDAVIPRRLVSECKATLLGLPGQPLRLVGSARLTLKQTSSVELAITDLTERHPMLQMLADPTLSAETEVLARYGLWMDMYAEPMPGSEGSADTHAISLVARVREPVGSTLIPRRNGAMPFTRIPRMLEQRVEADHAVPTTGTLMVVGLRNPFPASNGEGDQLVLLIGARGDKTPDPPRENGGSGHIVPADERHVVRPIGRLATEVLDYVAPEAWPRHQAASAPVSLETARNARFRHLQDVIARGAGLIEPDAPWQDAPIEVLDGAVVGRVSRAELRRLDRFITGLRRHENDVYEIDVVSAVTTTAQLDRWLAENSAEAKPQNPDLFVLGKEAAASLDTWLRETTDGDPRFRIVRTMNARATQRIGLRKLTIESIVRDQSLSSPGEKGGAYTAVPGIAEQGLIVEVRPRLESTPGYRALSVRARAARLQDIQRVPFPAPTAKGATVDVPRWYPLVEISGAPTLGDLEAVLLRMPMPGAADQAIVVKIAAKKVR